MTVGELLARISSQELSEWMIFFRLEPWGCEVEDSRAGIVAATVANVNRDKKARGKPYAPGDFMPKYDAPPKPAQTVQDQERVMGQWGRAWVEKFGEGDE